VRTRSRRSLRPARATAKARRPSSLAAHRARPPLARAIGAHRVARARDGAPLGKPRAHAVARL